MNDDLPGVAGPEDAPRLGEPRREFRAATASLVWGYILALPLFGIGAALLIAGLGHSLPDGDWLGAAVFAAAAALCIWATVALLRKADRLRRLRVVVHDNGLAYHDGGRALTCRWDEIEDFRGTARHHFEEKSFAVGGIPVPGTKTQQYSHTSHHLVVRRKDGAELGFTNEIESVVALAEMIHEGLARRPRPR
jgi:hypothetical protein